MQFLFAGISGLCSGIFSRSLLTFGWSVAGFGFLLGILFIVALRSTANIRYVLFAIFCICFAVGCARIMLADTPLPSAFFADINKRVSYEGVVVADPDRRETNQHVVISVSKKEQQAKILVFAPLTANVAVGERVYVTGTLSLPEEFETDSGRTFRYDAYLQKEKIRFTMRFATLSVRAPAPWYSVPSMFARIKHLFIDGIEVSIPRPHAALSSGIVIGGKSGLGEELLAAFTTAGLVQIIVLSGYNIMIVAELVMATLARLKLSKKKAAIAGASALIVFVCIAGLSAASVRASLMALIALYARATGRTYAATRALIVATAAMLLWNPLLLVFDPGFQLSVAATAGLVWLSAPIEHLFFFIRNAFWRNALATTLAAQVAVLPILLYETGSLSFVAIPANLAATLAVPPAMAASAVAGIAGILFSFAPPVASVIGLPAYLLDAYLIELARFSASLPFAAVTLPIFPFWMVFLAYGAIIAIAYYANAALARASTVSQLRLAKNAST